MPARPAQVYDFTAFSRRAPAQAIPGDRLDAQFRNHAEAINSIIAGLDELLRPKPIDLDAIVDRVMVRLEPMLERASIDARDARAQYLVIKQLAKEAAQDALRASEHARHAETLIREIPPAPAPLSTPLEQLMPVLGPNAGGFYAADVQGATATSADYAQVSIEWAEHMPDTIPGNILAINAISGDHWSARWWAHTAAASVSGGMAWYFLGAFDHAHAPTSTPTGDPLEPGMMYFDTTYNEMMIWNGIAWQPVAEPQPGITDTFYYVATAGQTSFPLHIPDKFGKTGEIEIGQAVLVYLNGVRQTPQDDYTMDQPSSTITLAVGAPAGLVLAIDLLVLPNQLAHGVALVKKLAALTPAPDGTNKIFTLTSADGTTFSVSDASQVIITVNGVMQEPVVAYTITGTGGNILTFVEAPEADAYIFGVWFTPATS